MAMTLKSLATPLLLVAFIILILQVAAEKSISEAKVESAILQESIVKHVNENAKAGWKAAFNPQLSNFTFHESLENRPLLTFSLKRLPLRPHIVNSDNFTRERFPNGIMSPSFVTRFTVVHHAPCPTYCRLAITVYTYWFHWFGPIRNIFQEISEPAPALSNDINSDSIVERAIQVCLDDF
ncbi:hypothetical protein FXO38_12290 [Capsicum annuum]|nr:hypothetical protein FXO38_12290 [Capsicum annuum]KAF3674592.1 hypothetical protein FXO37_06314 [Capsicum annuum]